MPRPEIIQNHKAFIKIDDIIPVCNLWCTCVYHFFLRFSATQAQTHISQENWPSRPSDQNPHRNSDLCKIGKRQSKKKGV